MTRSTASPQSIRVLIAISGGIAAYKVPMLIREFRKNGAEVKTVCTTAALTLVGEEALRTLSANPVYSDKVPSSYDMDHIRLAKWADVMLICPATANTIAKLAHGIADNLVTSLALAFEGPVLVAPAMNSAMWRKAATQENINILSQHGVRILPVEEGELACGDNGPGRMLDINAIFNYVMRAKAPQTLAGVRVLIASGPTEEPIDPVRVITNKSSGRMGAALAAEACAMGATVHVVSGPSTVPVPAGVTCTKVRTASDMAKAMKDRFDTADVCIMAAAVSDFRPRTASTKKIKRSKSDALIIELVPNPDILAHLGTQKRSQFLVGFALEDSQNIKRALAKMREKKCDMMILNDIGTALGTDSSAITILHPNGKADHCPLMNKHDAAREILVRIARSLEKTNA